MKHNKILSIAAAISLALPVVAAEKITGTVTDSNGTPIKQAEVNLHGSNIVVTTDNKGQFVIDNSKLKLEELHVSADGFNHQLVNVSSAQNNYSIELSSNVIEVIDVHATPLHASVLESATPISVLAGADLKNKHSSTLGDTLKNELGVHSSYYGGVASSPIIRGLDGPRVLVTQNGLDVGDVSRVGPDHVVATETSTVKQVEILRGPATLFYGSGAIGGVVNVVDNRVPTSLDTSGEVQVSHNTVSDEDEFALDLNTSVGQFALHLDAFWRDSNDIKVPTNPEADHDEHHEEDHEDEHEDEEHGDEEHHEEEFTGRINNTASNSDGFTVGGSYILDNGYVGVSFGQMNREYGIPGHAHHHHEEEHEDELLDEEHHDEEEHSDDVYAKMQQDRVQLLSELSFGNSVVSGLNTRIAYTDYEHSEIEEGGGTTFKAKTTQVRSDLLLAEMAGWHGALNFEYKFSDFDVDGEEAFSPDAETTSTSVGLLAERHFGNVLVQLGARIESVELDPGDMEVSGEGAELLGHHDDEGHDHEESEHLEFDKQTFNPTSFSAGLVWDFTKGYNLGLSYTRSERAPASAELFSFGPHIGTGTYEIGAMFELHEEDDEAHFDLLEGDAELETSNNIELSLRKF